MYQLLHHSKKRNGRVVLDGDCWLPRRNSCTNDQLEELYAVLRMISTDKEAHQAKMRDPAILERCNRILAENPERRDAWTRKAEYFFNQNRIEEYKQCMREARRLKQREVEKILQKAQALSQKRKYVKSIGKYNEAISLSGGDITLPGNIDAWYRKGLIFARLGRFNDAIDCFDRVLRLNPGFGGALEQKNTVLFQTGLSLQ